MNNLVSIIIPTRNEEKNIGQLLTAIEKVMTLDYEAIVVDDSDNNLTRIKAISAGAKVIIGKRQGLGQAIIDGIEAAQGDIIVNMDADLSHRAEDIPKLLEPILEQGCDMAIGSRYVKGGSNPGWSLKRQIVSRVACLLALPVTSIKDATSGFFAFKREILI